MAEEKGAAGALARKVHKFTDCDGTEHAAPPLTLSDIADIEDEYGGFGNWGTMFLSPRAIRTFLWCSLRKEGLTRAQVKAREWRWTREEVGEMFLMGDFVPDEKDQPKALPKAALVITEVLRNSGISVGYPLAGATPRPPEAPTGSPSSAPASPAASPLTT